MTHIIHNGEHSEHETIINIHVVCIAWKIDFNLALPSYEVDLRAVRNLVELTLGSPFVTPPRILFVSSVGVLRSKLFDDFVFAILLIRPLSKTPRSNNSYLKNL